MKISIILSVFFILVSCQSFKRSAFNPPVQENLPVHHISKKEESSQKVKEHLSKPYVSSHGEIEMPDHSQVDKWIHYFQTRGRERMEIYLSRSSRYVSMMKNVLREYNLPEDLVYVAMIESGFSPKAHSFANAVGYWQFIEDTGRRYGLKVNSYVDERRDPVLSTRAAAEYFKDLYNAFESWHLALASYNAGEYRISRVVIQNYTRDFWKLSEQRVLPRETANYVPKFIAAVRISKEPTKYGFGNVEYQAPLEYDTIKLHYPVSLKKMALKLGVSYEEIQGLNPRYRGEYVPIEEETVVRIPVGKQPFTLSVLEQCRMNKPAFVYSNHYWYRVRRGDTLYRLARRNRTTVSTIRRLNRMRPRTILRAGRKIKLPYYSRTKKRRRVYNLASVHVVKKGENLNSISKRYRLKLSKLKEINSLRSSSVIHPGQVLKLIDSQERKPASSSNKTSQKIHMVKKGETLIGIARKYNVSLPLLMEKNELNFKSILIAGRRIVIPN